MENKIIPTVQMRKTKGAFSGYPIRRHAHGVFGNVLIDKSGCQVGWLFGFWKNLPGNEYGVQKGMTERTVKFLCWGGYGASGVF